MYQHLRAANDPSGNPQRLYAEYDPATGELLRLTDEGYSGRPAHLRHSVELPSVEISRAEYHAWIRQARTSGILA